jgi:hypothetical protein
MPYGVPAPGDQELPHPEALRAVRAAATVARAMHGDGREVRFALAEPAGRIRAHVCDLDGTVLAALSPSAVLEIATGAPLPEEARWPSR